MSHYKLILCLLYCMGLLGGWVATVDVRAQGQSGVSGKSRMNLFPCSEPQSKSNQFVLKVNQKEVFVNQFKTYNYAHFEAAGVLECELNFNEAITECKISPQNKNVIGIVSGKSVSFRLPGPGYWVVRINGKHKFFIFVDAPETKMPIDNVNILSLGIDNTGQKIETRAIQKALNDLARTGKVLYFPPGIYRSEALTIPGDTKIWLAAGAILKAADDVNTFQQTPGLKSKYFILIKDAHNVVISGRGTIDGNGRALRDRFGDQARMRLLLMVNAKNVTVDGIVVRDPGSWNTQILASEDVVIRNVKMLNDPDLSNTDGFDPDASKRVLIDHCFAYCGDDNVAVKTTNTSGYLQDVEDITVRSCLFLTRKSSLKVGTETRGAVMKNILFENNDVVESDRGMALYCSDGALFQHITYLNNRFEDHWPDAKQCGIHFSINQRNSDSKVGQMNQVLIKDCRFLHPFPKASVVAGFDAGHTIQLTLDNLRIAGKRCANPADAGLEENNFTEVTFQ